MTMKALVVLLGWALAVGTILGGVAVALIVRGFGR